METSVRKMDDNLKFLYCCLYQDLPSLENLLQETDYNNIYDKFSKFCQNYLLDLKNSNNVPSPNNENVAKNLNSPAPEIKLKKKNLEKLVEKWRTPMASRTNFIVAVPKIVLPVEQERDSVSSSEATDTSTRKRSAFAADISITNEDDEEHKEQCDSEVKVKLFKNDKKATNEELKCEDDVKETEPVESGKNPSKKIKLNDQSDNHVAVKKSKKSKKNTSVQEVDENSEEAKTTKKAKGTKKKKGTKSGKKTTASAEDEEGLVINDAEEPVGAEETATVSKKTKKTKKTKSSKTKEAPEQEEAATTGAVESKTPARSDTKMKMFAKTPNTNNRRISKILLQSAIRLSTAKSRRPNTRRAAAEAAKCADKIVKANSEITSNTNVKTAEAPVLAKLKKQENPTLVLSGKKPVHPAISALKKTASGLSIGSPVKKLIGKFENINSTPGSGIKRKLMPNNVQDSISRIKTKNPIDERKIRTSQAKLEAKRKSVKKAQQFLQNNMSKKSTASISENITVEIESSSDNESSDKEQSSKERLSDKKSSDKTSTGSKHSTEKQTLSKEASIEPIEIMDETVDLPEPSATTKVNVDVKPTIIITKISLSPTLSETPKRLSINCYSLKDVADVNKMINATSPKVQLSKIPSNLVTGNQRVSSSSATAFLEAQQRRLTKDFAQGGPPKALTSYNPLAKTTPSKPSNYVLSTVANIQNTAVKAAQNKFGGFLDRNTPQKLSFREGEEKRKAELQLKEAKEKERLAEQERIKQEKRDESKKKREEKLKKIHEVKQKKELELEQKRKEIEKERQQLTVPKVTTSSSNNSFLQKSSFLNNTQNHVIKPGLKPYVGSIMDKLNPQPVVSKKLSAVDQEAISEFAMKMGKMKMLQALGTEDDNIPLTKTNKYNETTSNFGSGGFQAKKPDNLETTYVLQSPPPMQLKPITNKPDLLLKANTLQSYNVTPLQAPKLKDINNYDVSQLGSEDDTDDDEDPSKPIPEWAMTANLVAKVKSQNHAMLNFTRMFRAASNSEIILEEIFKTRRKKFTERSSSANWTCPPVWDSHGITGEESFMVSRKKDR